MSQIDCAAEVILGCTAPAAAQALADAGLLALEPVEPHTTPAGDTAFLGNQLQTDLASVWIDNTSAETYVALSASEGWGESPAILTPGEAREIAAALISAAAFVEDQENQND
jgi:hypothetical protein